ncbi:hypothetical protein A35E_00047 [secondary endosymbiont of Heteropsylla cubana]|uniref:Uncharacterized protein n=1 Tax=secondary endosymbiont of Heteropsylla cubana TaxID=134287 RepID=J3TG83_9ENTR|nr:hypothetical protein A35E_00047 [secondary endosymbiont of Heteropsylla cubana]
MTRYIIHNINLVLKKNVILNVDFNDMNTVVSGFIL